MNAKSVFSCALGMGRLIIEGWNADGLGGVGRIEVFEVRLESRIRLSVLLLRLG